jgi:hypothetical protein
VVITIPAAHSGQSQAVALKTLSTCTETARKAAKNAEKVGSSTNQYNIRKIPAFKKGTGTE